MTRPVLLIEIGADALPAVTPVSRTPGNWVSPLKAIALIPPPAGIEVTPAADSITITWQASPLPGAIYVVWRAPDNNGEPGEWSFVTRTTDTRYTYTDASGAVSWWKITIMVNGISSADSEWRLTAPIVPLLLEDLNELIDQVDQYSEAVIQQALEISEVNDKAVANRGYISQLQETKVSAEDASALVQQQVGAATGGMLATVQETSQAMTDLEGNLAATHNVKVQVTLGGRSYLAGIGLGVRADGGIVQSEIAMRADHFVFIDPADDDETLYYPFEIVNGVVYANAAMIRDGTINYAKISEELKTTNYVWDGSTGTYTGWRLSKDGSAQFGSDVEIRGTVIAEKLVGEYQRSASITWAGNVPGNDLSTTIVSFNLAAPVGEGITGVHAPMLICNGRIASNGGQGSITLAVQQQSGSSWTDVYQFNMAVNDGLSSNQALIAALPSADDARSYRMKIVAHDGGGNVSVTNISGIVIGVR
jgi:hypothetical protein